MAGERNKRVRLIVTLDVDFEPGTEEGFGGIRQFGRHVLSELDVDGCEVVGDGDNFLVNVVDVEIGE